MNDAVEHQRLSVVLATYNGARYLDEQLDSLNSQTRLPDELVVVDDASTDHTGEVLRAFERRARFPVHLIELPCHMGTCDTFAEGFTSSTGDILFICDQDDRWHPDKLAVMADRMAEHADKLLAFTDAVLIRANGSILSHSRWRIAGFGTSQIADMEHDPLGQMMMRQVVSGCTAAIRRELLDALLPFPRDLHPALPMMMYDRWISLLAAAAGTVLAIPERLVDYRIHAGQQIGIPALPLRRVVPQSALRLGQFVAPKVEKDGRFAYQLEHLKEISKRLAAGGLDSARSELWTQLAEDHLRLRGRLPTSRAGRFPQIARGYLDADGYRRFSLGAAAAASDLLR